LLVCGAALAFGTVAAVARGAEPSPLPDAVLLGLCSGCAAAAGTVVADVIARGVRGSFAFGLVAYTATLTYFVVDAIGVWLISRRPRRARTLTMSWMSSGCRTWRGDVEMGAPTPADQAAAELGVRDGQVD
jgi:hypothetical protein